MGKFKQNANAMYQHLIVGIGFMIPFVVTGGIATALSFLSRDAFQLEVLADYFEKIGSLGMLLMWPSVAGGMAYSIAKKPGLVAGCLAGFLATEMNTAFFGAAIGGYLAGYSVLLLVNYMKLPENLTVLKNNILIPIISSCVTVFILLAVVGKPLILFNEMFISFLNGMSDKSPILLGAVIGFMMIIDLAGPIGKSAYFFGVATLSDLNMGETSPVMAAVMIAGMVPPLSLALAMLIGKKYFPREDVSESSMLWVLGATFVTESVIAYTVKDLFRILPGFVLGCMIASSLSMYFNCGLSLPHGGVFAMLIPGAVSHLVLYIVALIIGIILSTLVIILLKKGANRSDKI